VIRIKRWLKKWIRSEGKEKIWDVQGVGGGKLK